MARVAVVVGVDVTGGMQALRGAATGARQVAEWLGRDGYEVTCLTDTEGAVTISAVFDAVNAFVERDDVSKLVLYFAGHGYLSGNNEIWLLSGAPSNPTEAIDGTASVELARASDIPHVIFVSDACRSVPGHPSAARVTGGSAFPNRQPGDTAPEIDIFFATRPGQVAYEMTLEQAVGTSGLFTKVLLDAHVDPPRGVLVHRENRMVVPNRWLKRVVPERVEEEAQLRSVALRQRPELRLECGELGFLASAKITKRTAEKTDSTSASYVDDAASVVVRTLGGRGGLAGMLTEDPLTPREADGFSRDLRQLSDLSDDDGNVELSLHMATGMLPGRRRPDALVEVVGAEHVRFDADPDAARVVVDRLGPPSVGTVRFAPAGRQAANVAITFDGGRGLLVPALRGYQCRVAVSGGMVSGIAFTPLPGSRLWNRYRGNREAVAELRAIAGAASSHNLLHPSRDMAEALADRVRSLKLFDPTLGVIAGVAYASVGLRDQVGSVLDYSRRDLSVDLFDLWLLAGAANSELPRFPACPLTTAAWSYLNLLGVEVPRGLRRAGRLGGFWTTFAEGEMKRVIDTLHEGEVR